MLRISAGLIALPVGLFLLPAPGPGTVVIAFGAVLLAREFRVAAQVLDWVEVRGRRLVRWAKDAWRRVRRPRAGSR